MKPIEKFEYESMTVNLETDLEFLEAGQLAKEAIIDINTDELDSPAIRRLIQDIQDNTPTLVGYNRMHNRHNRGR